MKTYIIVLFTILLNATFIFANNIDVILEDGLILTIPVDQYDTLLSITSPSYIRNKIPIEDDFIKSLNFISFTDTKNLSPIYEKFLNKNIYNSLGNSFNNEILKLGLIGKINDANSKEYKYYKIYPTNVHISLTGRIYKKTDSPMYYELSFSNKNNTYEKPNENEIISIKTFSNWLEIDKRKIKTGSIKIKVDGYKQIEFDSEYFTDNNVIFIMLKLEKEKK